MIYLFILLRSGTKEVQLYFDPLARPLYELNHLRLASRQVIDYAVIFEPINILLTGLSADTCFHLSSCPVCSTLLSKALTQWSHRTVGQN